MRRDGSTLWGFCDAQLRCFRGRHTFLLLHINYFLGFSEKMNILRYEVIVDIFWVLTKSGLYLFIYLFIYFFFILFFFLGGGGGGVRVHFYAF